MIRKTTSPRRSAERQPYRSEQYQSWTTPTVTKTWMWRIQRRRRQQRPEMIGFTCGGQDLTRMRCHPSGYAALPAFCYVDVHFSLQRCRRDLSFIVGTCALTEL